MAGKYGFASINKQLNVNSKPDTNLQNQLSLLSQNVLTARVTDIILNENHPGFSSLGEWLSIGTVFFEIIGNGPLKSPLSTTAIPLLPNSKNYPLVNELILLFLLPNKDGLTNKNNATTKQYYYLNTISVWNNQHINAYPDLQNQTTIQPTENKSYQEIEDGQTRKSTQEEVKYNYNSPLVGGTFIERSNIHPLLSYAGDVIIEGRWGNSIRFGSTTSSPNTAYNNDWSNSGENGNPITILRNGQPTNSSETGYLPIVENINEDLSSIYLTSNQQIPLITEFRSYPAIKTMQPETIGSYIGSQVILNSDRLIFNAKNDSIIMNSQQSIAISSIGDIGLYSRDNEITIQSKKRVNLGESNAKQSVMLGSNFTRDFEDLLKKLKILSDTLASEPQLKLTQGIANSVATQVDGMLKRINSYTSKVVKTI
jgi:hypothetical protein